MKIALYADLNDPYELMASDLTNKDIRRAVGKLKSLFHKNRGLLSFSKTWHNPVLWSHYADRHHGIALGFDVPDEYASPIKYRATRLPIKYKNKKNDELSAEFVHNLLHTKYKHWKYEEEIRLHVDLNTCKKENDLYFISFNDVGIELKEVILGHSCKTNLQSTRNLINGYNNDINVFKARLAFSKFKVIEDKRTVNG